MSQLHKTFGYEQVKAILRNYQAGQMSRIHAQELLDIGKSLFLHCFSSTELILLPCALSISEKQQNGLVQ